MSAAFTPGPWQFFTDVERGYFIDTALGVDSNNGYVIADNIRGQQASANARLIAAAPELYEALVALTKAVNTNELAAAMACHEIVAFSNVEDALKLALPAIRKARGGQ